MIRFGNPIKLKDFEKDYKLNEIDAVKKVTSIIRKSLNELTNYYQTDQIEDIVQGLELIYKMELMTELGMEVDNKNDDFITSKILTDAVQWYEQNKPYHITNFRRKLSEYVALLKKLDIRDEFLDPARQEKRNWGKTRTILFLIIGSPLFLWGIITNYIPYILPRILVKTSNKDQSEEASWKLIYGFIFFAIYYTASTTLVWGLSQNLLVTILFLISLIPSGDFALYYSKNIKKYKQHVKFLSIFYKKRSLLFEIIQKRMELLQYIEESKNRYLDTLEGKNTNYG
tara:strand:- start:222 stop:1076 length:855 start_codon:yes stop_codon:yes gene_type:complete